jgi:hypothetical protein
LVTVFIFLAERFGGDFVRFSLWQVLTPKIERDAPPSVKQWGGVADSGKEHRPTVN